MSTYKNDQSFSILDLLRSDGSIVVNKRLAHTIGLVEAVIYSELVSLRQYWSGRNELKDGEWFFCTIENLEENTTVKKDKQNRAITKLEKLGLVETKRMGLPARRYFKITNKINEYIDNKISQNAKSDSDGGSGAQNEKNADEEPEKEKPKNGKKADSSSKNSENPRGNQISQNEKTSDRELRKQEFSKTDTNNTRFNNTKINNTNSFKPSSSTNADNILSSGSDKENKEGEDLRNLNSVSFEAISHFLLNESSFTKREIDQTFNFFLRNEINLDRMTIDDVRQAWHDVTTYPERVKSPPLLFAKLVESAIQEREIEEQKERRKQALYKEFKDEYIPGMNWLENN